MPPGLYKDTEYSDNILFGVDIFDSEEVIPIVPEFLNRLENVF